MAKQTTSTDGADNKVKEPENKQDKKAAKAVSGKTKGEGKAVKAAKDAKSKAKGPTIGGRAVQLLKEGKLSPQEILEKIREEFPGCKTQMASIYWYAQHNEIDLQERRVKAAKAEKKEAKAA